MVKIGQKFVKNWSKLVKICQKLVKIGQQIWVFFYMDFLDWPRPPPFWPKVKKKQFFMPPLSVQLVKLEPQLVEFCGIGGGLGLMTWPEPWLGFPDGKVQREVEMGEMRWGGLRSRWGATWVGSLQQPPVDHRLSIWTNNQAQER